MRNEPWCRALALALVWLGAAAVQAETRIRFHVVTVEESGARRDVLSRSTIEGPPGTDFEIELRTGRFRMTANFLTDLTTPDELRVRTDLETRRLYGYSSRNLPLFEEDTQSHDFRLGFRERLVLLPFGAPDADERLKIEIAADRVETDAPRPLEIDLSDPGPDRSVNIRAYHVPHHYDVELALLRDGAVVDRAEGRLLLAEPGTLTVGGMDVALVVDGYRRQRTGDELEFDFRIEHPSGGRDVTGAGVTRPGSPLEYTVPDPAAPESGRDHVLRVTFRSS